VIMAETIDKSGFTAESGLPFMRRNNYAPVVLHPFS
jgi:hypothetical protein